MKSLRQFTCITAITILLSCSTDNEDINGHWHSTKPEWGPYKTLDIDDSITTWNKYQIAGGQTDTYLRKDPKTGKLYLPFQLSDYSYTYTVDNDTLKITMGDFSYKYLKSNIEECELFDRYADEVLNISLTVSPTAEDYEQLSNCANMFIGTSIKQGYQDPTKEYPDSVFIGVNDVFIKLEDVTKYCDILTKDTFDEPIELVLHADNSVNELFIKKILEKIPPTIPTYRAVNKGGQLGVSKITRD
jgi:hypothetical protein